MIGGDGINDESNKTAPAPTRNTDLTKNRERLARPKSTLRHSKISIHAPRRGSDDLADLILDTISRISIHAPRMGSDSAFLERPELHFQFQSTLPGWGATGRIGTWVWTIIFQSTLPGWGATVAGNIIGRGQIFQSTLPGWGATTRSGSESPLPEYFNPRSPDGERPMIYFSFSSVALFQSTLPGWGATSPLAACRRHRRHFNPRSPDGERLAVRSPKVRVFAFQSTLPGWGATAGQQVRHALAVQFQSTLPGWGATDEWRNPLPTPQNFNPRSPDGERRGRRAEALLVAEISIHAPRMGSDKGSPPD